MSADSGTFFCHWCSKNKPVETGFVLRSKNRAQCKACSDKIAVASATSGRKAERVKVRYILA